MFQLLFMVVFMVERVLFLIAGGGAERGGVKQGYLFCFALLCFYIYITPVDVLLCCFVLMLPLPYPSVFTSPPVFSSACTIKGGGAGARIFIILPFNQ